MTYSQRHSCLLIAAVACGAIQAADAEPSQIQTLLNNNCVGCHGPEKAEGDLQLDLFASKQWDNYELFSEIVARVEDGEMPPEDAKTRLPTGDRTSLLAHLKARLGALDDATLAGKYKKLTAQEYNNSLIDVLGAPVEKLRNLPFDSENDFKKLGDHQVVTSYAVKKYYDVASDYLDRHIVVDSPKVSEFTFTQPDNPKQWIHTSRFNQSPLGPIAGTGNAPAFMIRSPISSYAEEGEYELTFEYRTFYMPDKERFDVEKKYESGEAARPPNITVTGGLQVLNPVELQKNDNKVSMHKCRLDQPIRLMLDRDRKFITFRMHNNFNLGPGDDPRYLALQQKVFSDEKEKSARLKELHNELRQEYKAKRKLRLLVTGVTIRGPLNKQPSPVQTRIFGDVKRDDPQEDCGPVLKRLAQELFRRPVSDAQLKPYLDMARSEYDESQNTYAAVKAALTAMLCSPHFVFKYEGNQRELDDYMIAARLSYFLQNSTPDEELLALAADGKLKDPAVRREQAVRLLADREKSNRFTQDFTHGWLGMDKFGQFAPNQAYIESERYKQIQPHIAQEPQEFFNEILHNNLSALNFIDSDFVIWSRNLYSLYGGTGMRINHDRDLDKEVWQKMILSENPNRIRGGYPSMGAIMSLTTDGENPQPILRGVWLARRMLGTEIEAPATVPAIEINLENVSKPREVLDRHKEDRSCYACHVKFDYLGLAMENYDVLGRYKSDYVHPIINEKGRPALVTADPIDSLSETPDGQEMRGVAGLKAHLMERKDQVMRNLVEKLYSYALGREVRYKDRETIDTLLTDLQQNDYKFQDLVLAIVASESFARR